jgi:hypothetical protein
VTYSWFLLSNHDYATAIRTREVASHLLEKILGQQPSLTSISADAQLITFYIEAGALDKAESLCNLSIKRLGDRSDHLTSIRAVLLAKLSYLQLLKHDYGLAEHTAQDARTCWNHVLSECKLHINNDADEMNPYVMTLLVLATAELKQDHVMEATSLYDEALKIVCGCNGPFKPLIRRLFEPYLTHLQQSHQPDKLQMVQTKLRQVQFVDFFH